MEELCTKWLFQPVAVRFLLLSCCSKCLWATLRPRKKIHKLYTVYILYTIDTLLIYIYIYIYCIMYINVQEYTWFKISARAHTHTPFAHRPNRLRKALKRQSLSSHITNLQESLMTWVFRMLSVFSWLRKRWIVFAKAGYAFQGTTKFIQIPKRRFPKSWRYHELQIIQVNDHELALNPMVTSGSTILRNPQA